MIPKRIPVDAPASERIVAEKIGDAPLHWVVIHSVSVPSDIVRGLGRSTLWFSYLNTALFFASRSREARSKSVMDSGTVPTPLRR